MLNSVWVTRICNCNSFIYFDHKLRRDEYNKTNTDQAEVILTMVHLSNKLGTITKMLTGKIRNSQCYHLMCFYRNYYLNAMINNRKTFLV